MARRIVPRRQASRNCATCLIENVIERATAPQNRNVLVRRWPNAPDLSDGLAGTSRGLGRIDEVGYGDATAGYEGYARPVCTGIEEGAGTHPVEFVEISGYNRLYAARALRNGVRKGPSRCSSSGTRAGHGRGGRKRVYGDAMLEPLTRIWEVLGFPCGKRFAAILLKSSPRSSGMVSWYVARRSSRT